MNSQYVVFAVPVVAVLVGLVLTLIGFRKLGPKPGTSETADRRHARYGKYLRMGAPLMAVAALVFVLVVSLPHVWTRYASTDGACSAEFPETPRHETVTRDVTTNTLEVEFKDRNAHFLLSFSDLSVKEAARPTDDLFRGLRDIYAKPRPDSVPAQVIREQVLEERGFPGREFQFAVGDQLVTRIKVFVSGRRVYRVIAVNPPGDRADRDAQRFIDSFRFEISKP